MAYAKFVEFVLFDRFREKKNLVWNWCFLKVASVKMNAKLCSVAGPKIDWHFDSFFPFHWMCFLSLQWWRTFDGRQSLGRKKHIIDRTHAQRKHPLQFFDLDKGHTIIECLILFIATNFHVGIFYVIFCGNITNIHDANYRNNQKETIDIFECNALHCSGVQNATNIFLNLLCLSLVTNFQKDNTCVYYTQTAQQDPNSIENIFRWTIQVVIVLCVFSSSSIWKWFTPLNDSNNIFFLSIISSSSQSCVDFLFFFSNVHK